MRAIVLAALIVGCGPSAVERDACEEVPECLDYGSRRCDRECVSEALESRQLLDCCNCLDEFGCINATAERCASNIEAGGTVAVNGECVEDESRCGIPCDGVVSVN